MSNIIVIVVAVIAGSLICFEGYRLFRLSLSIAGGLVGFFLGELLIQLTGGAGIEWSSLARIIVLLIFTLGFGILAFKLYLKALIAITTIVCAFWFYEDFAFIFERVTNNVLRIVLTIGAGLAAGVLIGVIVYFAQKWTISLFTAFIGARMLAGVLSPVMCSAIMSGEYAGIIEQKILGPGVEISYSLVRLLMLAAFCAAGFAIQLKTSKKSCEK